MALPDHPDQVGLGPGRPLRLEHGDRLGHHLPGFRLAQPVYALDRVGDGVRLRRGPLGWPPGAAPRRAAPAPRGRRGGCPARLAASARSDRVKLRASAATSNGPLSSPRRVIHRAYPSIRAVCAVSGAAPVSLRKLPGDAAGQPGHHLVPLVLGLGLGADRVVDVAQRGQVAPAGALSCHSCSVWARSSGFSSLPLASALGDVPHDPVHLPGVRLAAPFGLALRRRPGRPGR